MNEISEFTTLLREELPKCIYDVEDAELIKDEVDDLRPPYYKVVVRYKGCYGIYLQIVPHHVEYMVKRVNKVAVCLSRAFHRREKEFIEMYPEWGIKEGVA